VPGFGPLRERGIILTVCSKNNRADVPEVFGRHPDMRLRADDIAVLSAGWDDKPTQIRGIADTLDHDEAPSTRWRLALDQAKPPPGLIRLIPLSSGTGQPGSP
jgi:hypothetical protein